MTYQILRVGMVLLVISGFGYLLLARLTGKAPYLYEPRLWAKLTLTVVIVLNALLLQVRKIPLFLGAAISLVSWYAALILGIWRKLELSYLAIMGSYILIVFIVAAVLRTTSPRAQEKP